MGIEAGEIPQVAIRGTGKGIDRLRGVTHDTNLVTITEPLLEQAMLHRADILELIDGEPPVGRSHLVGDIGPFAENPHGHEQHVIKINEPTLRLDVVVGGVDAGDLGRSQWGGALVGTLRVGVRIHLHLFGPGDLADEVTDNRLIRRHPAATRCLRHERRDARDDVVRLTADGARPEMPELTQGRGVKGAHLHALHAETKQSITHLTGGAGREGDGESAPRIMGADPHGVGNAVGDGAGLARAGSGPDDHGPLEGLSHGPLLGVEGIQEVIHRGIVASGTDAAPDPTARELTEGLPADRVAPPRVADPVREREDHPHAHHDVHHGMVRLLPSTQGPIGARGR